MGWDFGTGETKSDRIRDLTRDRDTDTASYRCLRRCVKGNVLWYVMEITHKGDSPGVERFIGCSLLGAMKDVGWGSKDMDESMGPCNYNVPLEYLDLVPEPAHNYGWRDKVRAYHAAHAKKLTVGETVPLHGCSIKEATIVSLKPLRGRAPNGVVYRLPRRYLVPSEFR